MFRLPDFLRTAWVSDTAREAWNPRFDSIRDAWPQVVLDAVAASSLECAIRTLPPWMIFRLQADAQRRGLAVVVLGTRGLAIPCYLATVDKPNEGQQGRPFRYEIVLGTEAACAAVEQFWQVQQYTAAHLLAGTPDCCAAAMNDDITLQRSDATWRYTATEQIMDAEAASMVDPLWSWLNVGSLSFAPCTLGCVAARRIRDEFKGLGRVFGYAQEMDWLEEVLSWPIEWTALHGIAELKTPVLKATWSTDVAHRKATLRYHGTAYPKEGATGLDFPFRTPSRPLLTSSQAFQRGIENLIQIRI